MLYNRPDQTITLLVDRVLSVEQLAPFLAVRGLQRLNSLLRLQFILQRRGQRGDVAGLADFLVAVSDLAVQTLVEVIRSEIQIDDLLIEKASLVVLKFLYPTRDLLFPH